MIRLPVDAHIDEIVATVRERRCAIVVAPPGSGKTTRIPPALTALGRTILLQPRRVAARTLARRIAFEQEWTLGREIGWHIRFERRFVSSTGLIVATEGILTARLQSDPLLSEFNVVVLDEFHERSIHADLALAMAKQAALSRGDLALVVMSATIDAAPLAAFLGAPVIEIDTRPFPIEYRYMPGASVPAAVRSTAADARGHILCFLPGAREIERAGVELGDLNLFPLHGSLDVDAQERALAPSSQRKVILATNVAETSLTVEGVTDVIDAGLQKVLRYDAETAVDHLVTEQISADSAAQRAGRAGRTGPGRATRLWDERMILRPHAEPEVTRIDLASTMLDIIAWGGDPETFEWFERPPQYRLDSAMELLRQLGAIEGRRLTAIGDRLRQFPLHPRLARMIVAAGGAREAVELAAEIAEGRRGVGVEVVRELERIARGVILSREEREGSPPSRRGSLAVSAARDDTVVPRAALAGYPDRVAFRRDPAARHLLLATGTGASLAREIEHLRGEFYVALEVRGDLVHRALPIERDWLEPTARDVTHVYEDGRVKAFSRVWYGAILLHHQQVPVDRAEEQRLLEANKRVDPDLLRRAQFAGVPHDSRELAKLAPTSLPLPSGRSAKLEYRDDGSIVASVKLQELFGLAETPRIGKKRTPVTFALLAPNGRPVQVTQDLRSFWNTTYQEVRRELRARYPKHPWPEDPWTAPATHRTKRR